MAGQGARPAGSASLWADPFEALDRLGVAVFRVPLKKAFEGAYTRPEGHPLAVVNSLTDFVRQRFTAAHELGHHVMYREGESPETFTDVDLDADPVAPNPDEDAADGFAVAFLMPRDLVARVTEPWQDDDRRVVSVMHAFEVSRVAAARRCATFGLITEATKAKYEKDHTTVPTLYALINEVPRNRRSEMGVTRRDHRLEEKVRLLADSPFIDEPARLLRLA